MVRFTVKGMNIGVLSTEELTTDENFLTEYFQDMNLENLEKGEALFTSSEGADFDLEYLENHSGELIFMPYEEGILDD